MCLDPAIATFSGDLKVADAYRFVSHWDRWLWGRLDPPLERSADKAIVEQFAGRLGEVQQVEAIFWRSEAERLAVWTVISAFDRDVEDLVFDAEGSILDSFPKIRIGFSVLYRLDCELEALRPSGSERAK
jgi:hypothetical protein